MKVLLLMSLFAFGPFAKLFPLQDPTLSSVVGVVQSTDAGGKTLIIKTDQDATLTITSSDSTMLLRVAAGAQSLNQASPIAFTDIAVGDRILSRGNKTDGAFNALRIVVLSKTDLAKHRE